MPFQLLIRKLYCKYGHCLYKVGRMIILLISTLFNNFSNTVCETVVLFLIISLVMFLKLFLCKITGYCFPAKCLLLFLFFFIVKINILWLKFLPLYWLSYQICENIGPLNYILWGQISLIIWKCILFQSYITCLHKNWFVNQRVCIYETDHAHFQIVRLIWPHIKSKLKSHQWIFYEIPASWGQQTQSKYK